MKSLALLLAFFTLFSTAIPCCVFDNCKDEPQSENSTNDEKDGSCSPFFVCSSCAGFVTLESHALIAIESVVIYDESRTSYPDYSQSFYSQICLGIWQPPKVG